MKQEFYQSTNSQGTHNLAYYDWGSAESDKIIVGVHGLTCNGRDFDEIAAALVKDGYRFIAVDLAGRGKSDDLPNPLDYNYDQYLKDLSALFQHLNITEKHSVDWLGVSLGGLLGFHLAAQENSPIKRMVVNDVGPDVPKEALDFIYQVISVPYEFETLQELEERMRQTRGLTWGSLSDEGWSAMASRNARELPNGKLTYSYDPRIAEVFKTEPIGAVDMWPLWEKISIPVLLIRGKASPLLTSEMATQMIMKKPSASMDFLEFEGCGHVPALMKDEHINPVREWLNTPQT